MKGKIINTLEVAPQSLYRNNEISDLIATIGIEPILDHESLSEEDKDELCSKLRYGKFINTADSDSDGFRILVNNKSCH